MSKRREVGFVITPDEIKSRIASLDTAIAVLDGDIRASASKSLGKAWRAEWDAFVRRWALERDSYASWGARLFATRVMPRLEAFTANYKWWARDYQKRSGARPPTATPAPSESMAASLIAPEVWWIAAAAVAYYILSSKGVSRG